MTQSFGGFPLSPWQMWGQTVAVSPVYRPAASVQEQIQISTQIVKVNYKRPETWSFFLGGKIVGGQVAAADTVVRVQFNISIGVGRSSFRTNQAPYAIAETAFALFSWIVPAGIQPGSRDHANNTKYTTQVQTPNLEDGALPTVRMLVDKFPAEDIQVYADVGIITSIAGTRIDLELTGYVAPVNHIRPEWFAWEGMQYRGDETGGT